MSGGLRHQLCTGFAHGFGRSNGNVTSIGQSKISVPAIPAPANDECALWHALICSPSQTETARRLNRIRSRRYFSKHPFGDLGPHRYGVLDAGEAHHMRQCADHPDSSTKNPADCRIKNAYLHWLSVASFVVSCAIVLYVYYQIWTPQPGTIGAPPPGQLRRAIIFMSATFFLPGCILAITYPVYWIRRYRGSRPQSYIFETFAIIAAALTILVYVQIFLYDSLSST